MSPTLFNIYINELAVLLEQSTAPGLPLNNTEVKFLLFADDLVLLSPSEQGLQQHLDLLETFSQNWALTVNLAKTKIVIFQKGSQIPGNQTPFHSRKHWSGSFTVLRLPRPETQRLRKL